MYIIIAGAGEVGVHAAEVLSLAGHAVTVIDISAERLRALLDVLDVRTLVGHCAHVDVLREAGCERCDLLVAATQVDECNLLTASLAKVAGAKQTIVRVHHTANFSLRGTPFLGSMHFSVPSTRPRLRSRAPFAIPGQSPSKNSREGNC